MLKVLRKKGVSKVIFWFLAVIIILAFGVFGNAYLMEEKAERQYKYAGKVFGKKVPFITFARQLNELTIVEKLIYGDNYRRIRHLLEQDRKQRTWVRIMLLKEAEKRDIRVSDEELVKFIETYPKFQVDGKFNQLLYNDILRNFLQVHPKDFEECFRNKLKIDQLTSQETALVTVSDEELKAAYQKSTEKVQVSYVLFASEDFTDKVPADEAKVREYFEQRKNDFIVPPMVNVEYLKFDFPAAKENEKTAEPGGVSEADKDTAWHKAYEVYQELKKAPADFAAIAAKSDLKIYDSGLFSMEQPNLKAGWSFELIQKIFEMKPNEVTQPVETAEGYQVLRLKESRPSRLPEFDEIKDKITGAWKVQEAAKLAKAKAEETLAEIEKNSNSFEKTVKSLGLKVDQTPVIGHGDYIPKLGQAPDFLEQAFSLTTENPVSRVAVTEKGYCILKLDNRVEPDMKDFDKEKEKFAQSILLEKKTKAFNDFLTQLRNKANLEDYLPEDKKIYQ